MNFVDFHEVSSGRWCGGIQYKGLLIVTPNHILAEFVTMCQIFVLEQDWIVNVIFTLETPNRQVTVAQCQSVLRFKVMEEHVLLDVSTATGFVTQ